MPPTFGWCRVVELADEFKVSSADILAICDRLGVVVEDASEWLAPDTVDLIRDIVGINGPKAVLSDKPAQTSKAPKAPKPPKAEKAPKAEKPPKPPRAEKAPKPARVAESPELGSVGRDGVRARRVVLIGLVIALLAGASGVFVDRWVGYVTNTDAPATVVTTGER